MLSRDYRKQSWESSTSFWQSLGWKRYVVYPSRESPSTLINFDLAGVPDSAVPRDASYFPQENREHTTLSSNDTALTESVVEELEVALLEESLGGTIGVGGVGDDDVELVLVVVEELEAIANVGLGLGVLEADGHALEVLLGETDNSLVNVAESGLLNTVVLDDLTEDTTVTTTNDKDLLGVGVGVEGEVGNHLLVGELIALGGLDDVVEDKDVAEVGGLEDEDVLVLALLVGEDLLNAEGHGMACMVE